jgi:DNA recombination protein RmuC
MYIPAEAIYYELINTIDKDYNIMQYAWTKKIIITSPNTLFLTLRIIEHWFKDTKLSEEAHSILKKLNIIIKDATKLSDNFRKLGNHISNAKSSYDETEDRMTKMTSRVTKLMDFKGNKSKILEIEDIDSDN